MHKYGFNSHKVCFYIFFFNFIVLFVVLIYIYIFIVMSALFRLIVIKIWLILLCFPAWLKSLLYALVIAIKYDYRYMSWRIRRLYIRFFKPRRIVFRGLFKRLLKRALKSLFLFIYFIYPIYFIIYLSFYFFILFFKYFLIFYFYFLVLRKRTSFVPVSFHYFFKLKIQYTKVYKTFIALNATVNYDLFKFFWHFVWFIFASMNYIFLEHILPIILLPFKFLYKYIYLKAIVVKDYYIIKFNIFYLLYLEPFFRKLLKKIYIFWEDWSWAIFYFIIDFFPRHLKRSFFPRFVTLIKFYSTTIPIYIFYYTSYYIFIFFRILYFYFIYLINFIIYIFLNILNILIYVLRLILFYLIYFIYWIIFRLIPLPFSIRFNNLKILYLDFLSLIYYIRSKF